VTQEIWGGENNHILRPYDYSGAVYTFSLPYDLSVYNCFLCFVLLVQFFFVTLPPTRGRNPEL